jgi:hypothetical protein
MKFYKILLLVLIILIGPKGFSQAEGSSNSLGIQYGISSGKYQPFWLRVNQLGTVPVKGSFMQVSASYTQEYTNYKWIKYGYGADVRFLVGTDQSALIIPELYAKTQIGIFEFWGGKRRQAWGLVDSTISSGSFVWSMNSTPMPKVEITVPEWYYPGILGGLFAFKGTYGHGWFENNRTDVAHFFLHQKSFYGQMGRKRSKVKLFAGFNHQVQWGGRLRYPDPDNISAFNGVIPTTLRDYLFVVTGISMGRDSVNLKTSGWNDARNRAGNHLGTIDLGAEISIGKVKILGYRQSYYEDGSLFWLNNITDGLHGIAIRSQSKSAFRKLVLEYFNSTSQGGPIGSGAQFAWQRGLDNYFNNGVYREGWSYRGRGIGTPFITSINETDLPLTNFSYFDNTRVESFYLASEWKFGETKLLLKGSLSNAIGWYGREFIPVKKMYSFAVFFEKPVQVFGYNAQLKTNVGYDKSEWYPSVFGLHMGLSMPLY